MLLRPPFITIFKSFIRPHLDYGDVICNQINNSSFILKLEQIQYKASLTIIGAIRTSKEKKYQELDLESLELYFVAFLIYTKIKLQLICSIFLHKLSRTKYAHNIRKYKTKHTFFKNSFFPSTIFEWNKLDFNIWNSKL